MCIWMYISFCPLSESGPVHRPGEHRLHLPITTTVRWSSIRWIDRWIGEVWSAGALEARLAWCAPTGEDPDTKWEVGSRWLRWLRRWERWHLLPLFTPLHFHSMLPLSWCPALIEPRCFH